MYRQLESSGILDPVIGTVKVSGLWWVPGRNQTSSLADINLSISVEWKSFILGHWVLKRWSQKWNLSVFWEKLSCIFSSWKWKIWQEVGFSNISAVESCHCLQHNFPSARLFSFRRIRASTSNLWESTGTSISSH